MVGFAVIAMPLFGSVQPKVQSVQASQIGPSARAAMPRPQSPKLPTPFAIQPVLIVLGCMLAGTVLLLVSETGRESLNSIDFERAYREQHKPNSDCQLESLQNRTGPVRLFGVNYHH